MTSKRNSRVFMDEVVYRDDGSHGSTYRSRRSSRSASREDMMQAYKDAEEGQRNGISIKEASTIVRSQATVSVGKEVSVVGTSNSGETTAEMKTTSLVSFTGQASDFPSAPLTGRPLNFGVVVPGVYRSSYPKPDDYTYIQGLKLKTIVTLVKKDDPDHDLETFITGNGIRHIIIDMKGTKKEAIPIKTMKTILSVVLDRQNHPLLIHCNHGKHRTGCVVAVVRKISGWETKNVVDEYKTYAEPKIRECDVEYISSFQVTTLKEPGDEAMAFSPFQVRAFFRALLFSAFVLILWLVTSSKMTTAATKRDKLAE